MIGLVFIYYRHNSIAARLIALHSHKLPLRVFNQIFIM
jgi:hypothetical protein